MDDIGNNIIAEHLFATPNVSSRAAPSVQHGPGIRLAVLEKKRRQTPLLTRPRQIHQLPCALPQRIPQFLRFMYDEVERQSCQLPREPIHVVDASAQEQAIITLLQNTQRLCAILLRHASVPLQKDLECEPARYRGHCFHQVGKRVEAGRPLKRRLGRFHLQHAVQAEGTQVIPQVTMSHHVPLALVARQAVWVEPALGLLFLAGTITHHAPGAVIVPRGSWSS